MAIQRKEGINKMIYVRATSTLTDDDDNVSSVCFPAEHITGMLAGVAATLGVIYFRSLYDYAPTDTANSHAVVFGLPTSQANQFFKDLTDELVNGEKAMIVLGDDVTGEYFSVVSGVLSITAPIVDD